MRELDVSAKERLEWVGGDNQDKQRDCRHLWKKSEFSICPEVENSHRFVNKGGHASAGTAHKGIIFIWPLLF